MIIWIKGRKERACLLMENNNKRDTILLDFPGQTDNQCEWDALIAALELVSGNCFTGVDILTDSLLLYKQITGENRIKSKNLKPLYFEYNTLKNQLSGWEYQIQYTEGDKNDARKMLC